MKNILLLFTIFSLSFSSIVFSAESDEVVKIREILTKIVPSQQPDAITKSPVSGLFEVSYGPEIMYITGDGRFLIQGDLGSEGVGWDLSPRPSQMGRGLVDR